MCNFPLMCCTTIPCFWAFHKQLFLLAHYNSLPSVPTHQANKAIDVEVYCQPIAMKKLLYWLQYLIFNITFCKCFGNPFLHRSYQWGSFGCHAVIHYSKSGEPIYYHRLHEMCIIVGRWQNQLILSKILPLSDNEEKWLLLTYYRSNCLSWSFVLTWCYTPTWVTKYWCCPCQMFVWAAFGLQVRHLCITVMSQK